MKRCKECGQIIRKQRSTAISTRFHGHITWMTRKLKGQMSRDEVYMRCLLKACEVEADGGAPYPYLILDDVLYPKRTTNRTNKEMMTAAFACELMAVEWEIGPLPEKYDHYGAPWEDDNDRSRTV